MKPELKRTLFIAFAVLALLAFVPTFGGCMIYGMTEHFYTGAALTCLISAGIAAFFKFHKGKEEKELEK